jgi:phospholipid/cholesterol/gamma-HCH transport system permease protein
MTLGLVDSAGSMGMLVFDFVRWLPQRPWRWRNLLRQVEVVGVNSTFVVLLTGLFTGMVLALQCCASWARCSAV